MNIDFLGPQGGALAMAFGAGCGTTATALITVWRLLLSPRETKLEAELQRERTECAARIEKLERRIEQLETLLMAQGPVGIRQSLRDIRAGDRGE